MTANCSPLPWDTVQMMMIMMGGGWSSREGERDSRATGESGAGRGERRLSAAVLKREGEQKGK